MAVNFYDYYGLITSRDHEWVAFGAYQTASRGVSADGGGTGSERKTGLAINIVDKRR